MTAQHPIEAETLGWAKAHRLRLVARTRYQSIWSLGIVSRAEDLVLDGAEGPVSLLDIGAGNRGLDERLRKAHPELAYKSLDTDETHPHDYRDLAEVKEEFDRAVMFEVIEHLPHAEGIEMLRRVRSVLRKGGLLFVSTPNVYHPFQYFRDASHVTPYAYEELGAAVLAAGFQLERMYRIHSGTLLEKAAKRWLGGWLFRFLGIDFAPGIVAVARKRD
ncbi:MAG: methyltransferase domain-containing protein [Planctomycetes bacterium]|nr:methyltransferase domain-containing protein [Planctomycetota bacterium]